MSLRAEYPSTSPERADRGTLRGALHVIEGGLSQSNAALGDLPVPVAESPTCSNDKLPYDCPPQKFESGGTRLSHDMPATVPAQVALQSTLES